MWLPRRPATSDLTAPLVTAVLLDQPWAYRERVVDEIVLANEGLYQLKRSIQLAPIGPLLKSQGIHPPSAPAVATLPLALLPKTPLLDFDVEGPGGEAAHLLTRPETSRYQVDFLLLSGEAYGVTAGQGVSELLFGLSMFMPGTLAGPKEAGVKDPAEQTQLLLSGTYGRDFDLDRIKAWRAATADVAVLLSAAMAAPPSDESSSENPLLALVEADLEQVSDAEVDKILARYRDFVHQLSDAGAQKVVRWLGELGRRYVALVDTVVDPTRRSALKMTERRDLPLGHHGIRQWCDVQLDMREARSYHLRVRSEDDSVRLRDVPVFTGQDGSLLGAPYFSGLSPSSDGYALYTNDIDRPAHVTARLPLGLSGDVRRSLTLVGALTLAAVAVALAPIHLDRQAVGVVTLPATFAGTVLLVRERTALAARVLRTIKWSLVAALLLLWLFALLRVSGAYYLATAGQRTVAPSTATPSPSTVTPPAPTLTRSSADPSPTPSRPTAPGTVPTVGWTGTPTPAP